MAPKIESQQYVLLPIRGLREEGRMASVESSSFLLDANHQFNMLSTKKSAGAGSGASFTSGVSPKVKIKVLDSIAENGAKLVELSDKQALNLRENQPLLKLVPVVYYFPQVFRRQIEARSAAASSTKVRLKIVSAEDGKPVAGARVIAFTDFTNGFGAEANSNSQGFADLALGAMSKKLERFYIYPAKDYWTLVRKNITVKSGDQIQLTPIDLSFTDALRHFYGDSPDNAGTNVKVGVVDTGIALDHPDLVVVGGENTVLGENANDFGDNGHGHGTHCGGIIAARGTPPMGIRGVAPGASLFSYRVFGKNTDGASNFAIAKAIDRAVQAGCDLINMSLGGGSPDDAVRAAMEDAVSQGSVVLVASGNDDRSPVSFPASFSPPAIAVSAMGRKGTFLPNTTGDDSIKKPFGTDTKNFVASFSNIGDEIDLTGTGVAIISTVPNGYAVMDGTSMATPAVTGFAARLLAGKQAILGMPRNASRSNAMTQELFATAKLLGFGKEFEGQGLPT